MSAAGDGSSGAGSFRAFTPADVPACLALFDANCPEAFAPGERGPYAAFLSGPPEDYRVCELDGRVVGAFGLEAGADDRLALRWILLDPAVHGRGLGAAMMGAVAAAAGSDGVVTIAASQVSAPFFARFGAVVLERLENGWGPGLHRLDMLWRPGARPAP